MRPLDGKADDDMHQHEGMIKGPLSPDGQTFARYTKKAATISVAVLMFQMIFCWNVNGLLSKLSELGFRQYINSFEISFRRLYPIATSTLTNVSGKT